MSAAKWWTSAGGEAFERELLEHLDEDDAMTVIALVQKSFVPDRDRLWVNGGRTVMVRLWANGTMEVCTRSHPDAIWPPPVYVLEEE